MDNVDKRKRKTFFTPYIKKKKTRNILLLSNALRLLVCGVNPQTFLKWPVIIQS